MTVRTAQRGLLIALAFVIVVPPCPAASRRDGRDNWQQPDRVVADLGLKPGDAIADIGAGSGYFTFRLAEAVGEKGKVYATDISERAVKSVAGRAEREGADNVVAVLSEPTATNLSTASLDAAMIVNVLHHVPEQQRPPLVKDIARALKPGGCFFIIDWRVDAEIGHDRNRRIPKDDLVKLGRDAGLEFDAEFYYLVNQVFLRFRKPSEAE
jgi:predicted methyltransferase